MGWINKMTDKARQGIRSFLRIESAQRNVIRISETLDFESNAIKNRIWYRGDSDELSQLYKAIQGDKTRFWAAVPTVGLEIRKSHTGLPGIIADILTSVVMADMNDIKINGKWQTDWTAIALENNFDELLAEAVTDTLVIGDGAFKISFDPALSQLPIIEFISGENINIEYSRGRVREITFKALYHHNFKEYTLLETYGFGYIKYELRENDKMVDLHCIPQTDKLADVTFDDSFIMALPFKVFKSSKWRDRGKSIFDGKADSFDSLDEAWSQWMDALRKGRSKEYIPSNMIPKNPSTGALLKLNAFDNAFIECGEGFSESGGSEIKLVQPVIPHESYLSTYITALDQCLQGLISPSTLGIDVKKLDNAEAQREKEKATLYTRNAIVKAMQKTIPKLIDTVFKAYATWLKAPLEDTLAEVPFGEYANPSFESQVETVAKGKQGGIMSIEACVDELYGDSKDEAWKAEEVMRLKAEQGIAEMQEPEINTEVGEFETDVEPDSKPMDSSVGMLNGAQISSLMNVIGMVKQGAVTRSEAIAIITSTLGISKDKAESFIEDRM